MKVLFLNAPGFDYLGSQLNEGFHLLSKAGEIEYKCLDRTTNFGAMVEDLEPTSVEDAAANAQWADLIMVSFGQRDQHSPEVLAVFDDESLAHKRVFIDVYDCDGYLTDPSKHLLYFKRELRHSTANEKTANTRSLVFGVYQNLIDNLQWHKPEDDWDNRDVDISFMAFGGSNTLRPAAEEILDRCAHQLGWNIECHVQMDGQPIAPEKYHEILFRSKVGISLPGAGFDTHRFWDIPGHGAVLCSFDISHMLWMRNGFEPHRHCAYFSKWEHMVEQCRAIVTDKNRWVQMRCATDQHLQFHSSQSRAREVLQMFSEMNSAVSSLSL